MPLVLVEAVDTVLAEGAPVTPVVASVTSALFTGAEVGPLIHSFCLPTVETTARDIMSRQLPPIRGQSGFDVGTSMISHSLIVVLVWWWPFDFRMLRTHDGFASSLMVVTVSLGIGQMALLHAP